MYRLRYLLTTPPYEFTGRNPPPFCASIPGVKKASACLQIYDNELSKKLYHGCAKIEVKLMGVKVFKENIGCFDIKI